MKSLDESIEGLKGDRDVEYPSLELSSDSEEDEYHHDDHHESPLLMHNTRSLLDSQDERWSSSMASNLLSAVSNIHLQDREYGRRDSHTGSLVETRSCVSSPGKSNLTLREKLSKLKRHQRKERANRAPEPPLVLNTSNSILEDHPPELACYDYREPTQEEDTGVEDSSLARLKRQALYGTRVPMKQKQPHRQTNHIALNIYDLIAKDTLMQLPWGCMCEIGKCFNEMNTALHELGTGAYHVGVEVNGVEYAFGATSVVGKSGVFSCIPKLSPGYQYRTTIDFGERALIERSWISVPSANPEKQGPVVYREVESFVDGRQVIKKMVPEYMGIDYDILRKNCCTFARDACLRLGIREGEIPSWFRNLAESGAMTQDVAYATMEPLLTVLSSCEDNFEEIQGDDDHGFEVIAKRNVEGTKEVLLVVPSPVARSHNHVTEMQQILETERSRVRRTATWTY